MDSGLAGLSFKRIDGVITGRQLPPGPDYRSGDVKYRVSGAFTLGASGLYIGQTMLDVTRPFSPDAMLSRVADINDPATITISPSGEMKLFVFTEVWAVTDCVP